MRYPGLQVLTALLTVGVTAGAQTPTPAPQAERERIVRRVITLDSAALNRASLGVTLSRTGTRRDTLGIFISSVAENGPAERAGIFEGDRIAAINGVDVRTAASDVGDSYLAGVAQRRLTMELRRLTAGQRVSLRVWSGGRYKDVQVTTARLAEVYPNRRVFSFGDVVVPMPGVGRELRAAPLLRHRMLLPGHVPTPQVPPVPLARPAPPAPPAEPFSFDFAAELEVAARALASAELFAAVAERTLAETEESFRGAEAGLLEWEDSLLDVEVELQDHHLDQGDVQLLTSEALRQAHETLATLDAPAETRMSAL